MLSSQPQCVASPGSPEADSDAVSVWLSMIWLICCRSRSSCCSSSPIRCIATPSPPAGGTSSGVDVRLGAGPRVGTPVGPTPQIGERLRSWGSGPSSSWRRDDFGLTRAAGRSRGRTRGGVVCALQAQQRGVLTHTETTGRGAHMLTALHITHTINN